MSLAAALVLLAPAGIVPSSEDRAAAPRVESASTATASVQILRPAVVIMRGARAGSVVSHDREGNAPVRRRDAAGTLWIEFS